MLQLLRKKPYIIDILILITILVISFVERIHNNMTFYRAGLGNSPSLNFMLLLFLYEPLKIGIVLFSVFRIFIHIKSAQGLDKYVITATLSAIILVCSWILPFIFCAPGAVYFLKGFEKWAINNVDIDDVQAWIQSEESDIYIGKSYNSGEDLPDELPDFIKNVNSLNVAIYNEKPEKGKCIEFKWSGLSDWGIVIGLPTMEAQQDVVIKHSRYYYEFRRSIKAGIFIYDAG